MRTSEMSRRLRTVVMAGCVAALAGAAGTASAQGQRCPDGDERVARVSLTVDYEGGTVAVEPWSVEIFLDEQSGGPRRVCWVVGNLREGDTLTIDGKGVEGPDPFPGLSRAIRSPRDYANSGNPERDGTWRYGLTVTNGAGEVVAETDPEVIVRGSR